MPCVALLDTTKEAERRRGQSKNGLDLMTWLNEVHRLLPWFEPQLWLFMLVLTRASGLVMTAPLLGARDVPLRVRALFSFARALVLTPF